MDLEYHARALEMSTHEAVALTYRRGGNNDLGLLRKDDVTKLRSFAVWGVPFHMGPDSLGEKLKELGWDLKDKPSESRSHTSPWKIYGVPPSDEEKFLLVVPWKNRRKEDESLRNPSSPSATLYIYIIYIYIIYIYIYM